MSLFAAELEEPKIGISGKGLSNFVDSVVEDQAANKVQSYCMLDLHVLFCYSLLKGAEEFGVLKFLKSEYGSGHREFVYEEQHCFEGIEDEENFFTSQERQFIVYNMLLNFRAVKDETLGSVKFLEGQSIGL